MVDDSTEISSLIEDVLSCEGASVTVCDSGEEAMSLLQISPFHLVILDLLMPRPNGRDILAFCRQLRPDLLDRTIVLTAERRCPDVMLLGEHRIRVAHKPFDLDVFRATAREVIDRAQRRASA
ncbi:MAG: response regulator [Phycisphaerae bacterium]|nr:response regulator [Phycisphaerae bacterium]